MEDWNRRYGAAICRGLLRFSLENLECREAVAAISISDATAGGWSLQEARLVECWRIARQHAAGQGVDVQDFLLALGAESESELTELLASEGRRPPAP